jgi:aminoglycoside phosphotransferase family enzyme/predicted kinase
MAGDLSESQSATIEFLREPRSYPHRPRTVERIDTHGAVIFLAGSRAYKLKRAVKLAYLDFSSLEKRRAVCERELALNRATAPELYLGVLPIMRDAGGRLSFQGGGEIVDWVIEMRRFDGDLLFDALARAGRLHPPLVEKLAQAVERFHARAPQRPQCAWPGTLAQVIKTVTAAFAQAELADLGLESAIAGLRGAVESGDHLLNSRREAGFVRRCHGDLHLRNIVLIDGEPRLFDALEFDEELATVDVLYDLGFLLMDLWHRGLRGEANLILNHYFAGERSREEWAGLALLPLFLSLRAGVRAMVGLDGMALAQGERQTALHEETRNYAALSMALIAPPPPRLIAIAGLSGTGKTTIARALAPWVGAVPGAMHLRSDLERKALFGVSPAERLDAHAYAEAASARVYERLSAKAEAILRAGHSVILDATFLREEDRAALADLAARTGVPLDAVWLEADAAQLTSRVTARRGDASDADAAIVCRQLAGRAEPPSGWRKLDARGGSEATIAGAAALLGLVRKR